MQCHINTWYTVSHKYMVRSVKQIHTKKTTANGHILRDSNVFPYILAQQHGMFQILVSGSHSYGVILKILFWRAKILQKKRWSIFLNSKFLLGCELWNLIGFLYISISKGIMLSLPLSIWPRTMCQGVVYPIHILNGMMYDCMVTSDWIICLGHPYE